MDEQLFQIPNNRKSVTMERYSVSLGCIALLACILVCAIPSGIIIAPVCSSLAIMFALLSRGGEMTLSNRSKLGLGLGIGALCLTIFILLICICCMAYVYYAFGGPEEFLHWYCDLYQLDYNTYFGDLNFDALEQLIQQ